MFPIAIECKASDVINISPFTHQSLRMHDETEINEIIIW